MTRAPNLESTILAAWKTNNCVNEYLVEHIASALWSETVPGSPTRTIRMIAAHLHNARCGWIRTLGSEHGIAAPERVDRRTVTRKQLIAALRQSSRGIEAVLQLGLSRGGQVPPSKRYVWRNLPLDVGHVLTYFVAHEAHHRGQIVLVARQLKLRPPPEMTDGLWNFTARAREHKDSR